MREETGASLVELMVVGVLLAIVGGIVLTGVVSAHRVARHAESRVQAVTAIHSTLANVSRQVRAADSRDTADTALAAASPDSVEADVFRGGLRIRYTFTLADGALVERRREWDATADSTSSPNNDVTRTLMTDLVNSGDPPLFAYHTADGSCVTGCLDESGTYVDGPASSAALADIAEVRLAVRRDVGQGPPIEVLTRVVLRNA